MRPVYRLLLVLALFSSAWLLVISSSGTGADKVRSAGNLYLLTITVGTHEENGTPDDWNYTAQELERIVKARCGPLFHTVKSNLVRGSQATPQGVLQGFDWLHDNVGEQDLALVYIGSHGGQNAQRGFCLYANDGNVYGNQIKPALARIKGRVVFVLQACCAGDLLLTHKKDLEAMPKNVAVICACRAGQHSHGIMLPPTMEALYGWADANQDGVVSIGEFLHYIDYRINTFYPGKWASEQKAVTGLPKDFDLAAPLARALSSNQLGKEAVMIEFKDDWYGGLALPKKDPTRQGRRWVHWFGLKASDDEWVPGERICPPGMEPAIVRKGAKWHTAALLDRAGDDFRIQYIGVLDNKEETVARNRIQAYSLAKPKHAAQRKRDKNNP